jgi:MOSC domain-containing protein YiiM
MAVASSVGQQVAPQVVSVNVGAIRQVEWFGRQVTSAIWKHPVDGPVAVVGVNLVGDDQADRRVHGGVDKAVYAYAVEDYDWWAEQLGRPMVPGTFGENLTTVGVNLSEAGIGDRWQVGTVTLEVAQPRTPCFKLGIRMDDPSFPGLFDEAGRPGVYLRIIAQGMVAAGDPIVIRPAASPSIKVRQLVDDGPSRQLLQRIHDDGRVPVGWRQSAQRALGRSGPQIGVS